MPGFDNHFDQELPDEQTQDVARALSGRKQFGYIPVAELDRWIAEARVHKIAEDKRGYRVPAPAAVANDGFRALFLDPSPRRERHMTVLRRLSRDHVAWFSLHVPFKLMRAYFSREEGPFHALDAANPWRPTVTENPIVRDRLTGCPMIRSTSWRGHLRFAMSCTCTVNEDDLALIFGPRKSRSGEETKGREARLRVLPSYFPAQDATRDVITPLNAFRVPLAGAIGYEVMPVGAVSELHVLYVATKSGQGHPERDACQHLGLVLRGVEGMLMEYGFSAKRTSGFGVIHKRFPEQAVLWASWAQEPICQKSFFQLKKAMQSNEHFKSSAEIWVNTETPGSPS